MKYLLTPYNNGFEHFAWWANAFNEHELNWLQQKAFDSNNQAKVGDGSEGGGLVLEARRTKISWLGISDETNWVYERLAHVVSSLNSQFFKFDLTGFGEDLQLTNYHENEQGMYNWHVDFGNNYNTPSRKLSLVLQLSDPSEYEGGNLEIQPFNSEVIKIKKQRGLVTCFPSWTLHQVTPVIKGARQSLVAWINGPSFK